MSAVNTFNEWDPLEEIIVGRVDDKTLIPPWDTVMPEVIHDKSQWPFYKQNGGRPWPKDMLDAARRDIEELVHILEHEHPHDGRGTGHRRQG
jgi:glycine amidinotransferase